ncbi:MAG: hypothetical protein E5V49_16480 [Mesorhizobium sp.]|nr:hypothetical protein EN848_19485 [bacterium M00.F.Ca.ET.205.01.1.1]TGU52150.1 hypothetical protein EN795_19035 [bacterium M00.F.Ca.ET.152.01.1.1]TGV33319.1 hypothetical protein EN829_024420 [Mesorhizobium sp. M00.F.Ca.ET.186.01.1.1]TGZ42690.1 hypothetical protein EN805_14765 [bacterium M00.F.Ca.ET.162.01.1.1]TJW31422.1 MAG: hypothetical protein E5V49_16480 [Mesorhizobium sp.]
MLGRIVPFFLGVALLFGSGCSRSYDGTVIIPRQLDARRFWDRPPPNTGYGQVQPDDDTFPVTPPPTRQFSERRPAVPAARRKHFSRVSTPPASSSQEDKLLACRNVTEPGKRVRMVCD